MYLFLERAIWENCTNTHAQTLFPFINLFRGGFFWHCFFKFRITLCLEIDYCVSLELFEFLAEGC